MSDVKRVLIGSVQLGKTKKGKVVAELYSTDKRLEFPALVAFDLSILETVDIDPNDLGTEPVYKRFWAHYTESEKTTNQGNPYLDLQYLEPIDNGNGAPTATDLSPVLTELRAIRELLETLVAGPVATVKPVECVVDGVCTTCGWKDPVQETGDLPPVALGDSDEAASADADADWLGDAETRAQEQAIHDELEAMNEARQNGKTADGVPMDSKELVAWLNGRSDNPKTCDSVGHLMYVMKKQLGDDWGWPNGTDQAGWNEAAKAWYEYWKALA